MNEMKVFAYDESVLRAVRIDGEPWFVGKDVAAALGYENGRKAIADHVDEEDKRQGDGVTIRDSIGREQSPTVINESGLYSLIFGSRLAEAKKFKRWVTSEVLPALRKTGAYSTGEPLPSTSKRAQTLDALAKSLAEVRRMHKAGLVRADDAARMALSLFGLADAPVQDTRLALDDSELAASVGAFFRERVAFRLVSNAVSSRDLYEAWRERSGAQNVTRRVFSTKVRRLFPSLVHKQIRTGENGTPEWHFCGIALRKPDRTATKQKTKQNTEENK